MESRVCSTTWMFHQCPEGWKVLIRDDTPTALCGKRRHARSAVVFGRTQKIARARAEAYMKAIACPQEKPQ